MAPEAQPLRLFLDTGVIVDGCTSFWGASKAVLILATERRLYTVVLAEEVERELQLALERKAVEAIRRKDQALAAAEARRIKESAATWLTRVRLERRPRASQADLDHHERLVLPVLRHHNDLPPVVSAIRAQPDWVISTNDHHWSPELAKRTGLHIVTPREFLLLLKPSPS